MSLTGDEIQRLLNALEEIGKQLAEVNTNLKQLRLIVGAKGTPTTLG